MSKTLTFIVAGGDARQIYAAKKLAENHNVYIYGIENATAETGKAISINSLYDIFTKADCMLLPLPVSQDGIFLNTPLSEQKIPLSNLTNAVKPNGLIIGGKFSSSAQKLLAPIETVDYSERETFSILNAVPTAEAAVKIALENSFHTLCNSKVLVTGFGRISKALIKILRGFGADITVAARKKSDLTWAELFGFNTIYVNELEAQKQSFDFVFNTVPAPIINENVMQKLNKDTFIIDLASKPGGVDFDFANKSGITAIHALSLPGIHFPKTAGEIIAATALQILKERSSII